MPISAPLLPVQQVENPEGFQFNDLRLTTNADETITAAVSLSNEEGKCLNSLPMVKGRLKPSLMLLISCFKQTVRLASYNIDAVTDGIDAQARVLVSVENVDTDTIFNASGFGLSTYWKPLPRLYQCQHPGSKRECGWDGTSCLYRDLPQA